MPKVIWNDFSDLFSYDPITGFLHHLRSRGKRLAGDRACYPSSSGYLKVSVSHKDYYAHRVAWYLQTGNHPTEQIDHINGDKRDNRWENLREATNGQNSMNRKKLSNNTSGFKNVDFHKASGKWRARVREANVERCAGYFDTPAEAYEATKVLREKLHREYRNA